MLNQPHVIPVSSHVFHVCGCDRVSHAKCIRSTWREVGKEHGQLTLSAPSGFYNMLGIHQAIIVVQMSDLGWATQGGAKFYGKQLLFVPQTECGCLILLPSPPGKKVEGPMATVVAQRKYVWLDSKLIPLFEISRHRDMCNSHSWHLQNSHTLIRCNSECLPAASSEVGLLSPTGRGQFHTMSKQVLIIPSFTRQGGQPWSQMCIMWEICFFELLSHQRQWGLE